MQQQSLARGIAVTVLWNPMTPVIGHEGDLADKCRIGSMIFRNQAIRMGERSAADRFRLSSVLYRLTWGLTLGSSTVIPAQAPRGAPWRLRRHNGVHGSKPMTLGIRQSVIALSAIALKTQ
jgi:hypothetical protein